MNLHFVFFCLFAFVFSKNQKNLVHGPQEIWSRTLFFLVHLVYGPKVQVHFRERPPFSCLPHWNFSPCPVINLSRELLKHLWIHSFIVCCDLTLNLKSNTHHKKKLGFQVMFGKRESNSVWMQLIVTFHKINACLSSWHGKKRLFLPFSTIKYQQHLEPIRNNLYNATYYTQHPSPHINK